MEPTDLDPDLLTHTIDFELTPIEANQELIDFAPDLLTHTIDFTPDLLTHTIDFTPDLLTHTTEFELTPIEANQELTDFDPDLLTHTIDFGLNPIEANQEPIDFDPDLLTHTIEFGLTPIEANQELIDFAPDLFTHTIDFELTPIEANQEPIDFASDLLTHTINFEANQEPTDFAPDLLTHTTEFELTDLDPDLLTHTTEFELTDLDPDLLTHNTEFELTTIEANQEPTDLAPDPLTHTIEFELTPIEANSARRFKRVALVIPLVYTARDRILRTLSTHQYVQWAFSEALALWPILGGSITCPGGQLTVQARMPDMPAMSRDDLINVKYTLDDHVEAETLILQVKNKKLPGIFFPVDWNTLDTGVPPLLLKLTFIDDSLVMGFCFYEVVADNAFIGQFLASMIDVCWDHPGRIGSYSFRTPLEPIDPTATTRHQFRFYDWSDKPIAQLEPRKVLVCQLLEIQEPVVLGFIQGLRTWHTACKSKSSRTFPASLEGLKDKDFFAAMVWAAITKARYRLRKISASRQVSMNILLSGERHVRQNNDWAYFGSSAVPALASVYIRGVIDIPQAKYTDRSFPTSISNCKFNVRWIVNAATRIRKAIDSVDADYIRRLMGLKQMLSMEEDSAAYERGLARSSTGTTFEDWSDFYQSAGATTGIPYTDAGEFIQVLPCADDLEEGRIILLPHFKATDDGHCENRPLVWLCLESRTMMRVRWYLEAEGWVKAEEE